MRNLGGALLLALGLVVGGCAEPEPKLPVADTIYTNGYVYTVDGARRYRLWNPPVAAACVGR